MTAGPRASQRKLLENNKVAYARVLPILTGPGVNGAALLYEGCGRGKQRRGRCAVVLRLSCRSVLKVKVGHRVSRSVAIMAVFRQKRKTMEEPPQPFTLETSGSCASTLSGAETFGAAKRRRTDQVRSLRLLIVSMMPAFMHERAFLWSGEHARLCTTVAF